jgi:C-terminal processing protease CtpA/Prc
VDATYTHLYIHSYIHTHIHTYFHTYIHTGGARTCGVGIVLEKELKTLFFYVKRVVTGGPAWSAGLQQGDMLMEIDGHDRKNAYLPVFMYVSMCICGCFNAWSSAARHLDL